jgi:hypothetical protein
MRKKTLSQIIDFVNENHFGASVISTNYTNSKTKMVFKCKNGHVFSTRPASVTDKGVWCQRCAGRKLLTIQDLIDYVNKNRIGAVVVTMKYLSGKKEKMDFLCEKGHAFSTPACNVFNNRTWCPTCGRINAKLTYFNKYGVDNPSKNKEVLLKKKATSIKNYGVDHPSQNKEVALKQARSANNSYIKFHWKTNEELVCQGSWEAKTVDHLNTNKIEYDWQPKIFTMPNGKTYRPDLLLTDKNVWVEIKGWMRKDAQEKWDWFKSEYSNADLWNKEKLKSMGIL